MTTTLPPNVTSAYNLGPVKSWVANAGSLLGQMFGIKTEYGWRQSDQFPDHPSGHAVDFMTPNQQAGDQLAAYAVANRENLGVKYVIWNRKYYGPENGYTPVPYTATSNPHTDHVHITFTDQAAPWTTNPGFNPGAEATLTAATFNAATCAWTLNYPTFSLGPVQSSGNTCLLSKKTVRELTGSVILSGGVLIGLVGAVLLMVYGLNRSGAAKYLRW